MEHFEKAVFGFADCEKGARALAKEMALPFGLVDVHSFPDGESRVTVPISATGAILYRPLHQPNSKIFEVIQAASALRDNGAKTINFVCPYLPYMRQDKVFHAGEALSQKVFGDVISPWMDAIITVEPHLHRTRTMDKVFSNTNGVALSGGLAMADYYRKHGFDKSTLVLGPDEEAWHTAKPFAEALGLEWTAALKDRKGDRTVVVTIENTDLKGRPVIIVDDVISSGMTVFEATKNAYDLGAKSVEVAAVHALFNDHTHEALKHAGVSWVISCDGVPHFSNKIPLAPIIAKALKR